MSLVVFNSMSREKEVFQPRAEGKVGMYVCGVTVYDYSHIGHARCYVAFDVIRRWLMEKFEVRYVQNFTDVDDKIIRRANESGEDPIALASRFADEFHRDMDDLGVLRPDVEPRVSTHMAEIIAFTQNLIDKGFAYRVASSSAVAGAGDDVYFRVRKFGDRYTQLSGRNLDDMVAGARVNVDERKEDPLDFALWKSAKPDEPFWESPFGKGRPGWHIECSAMSESHLGPTFDIHGGGKDLVFPHHTNEVAQSECCHDGEIYARYWMHNGFVDFAGEKMSKSLGNFFTIREVTRLYHPEALRFFLLTAQYRSPLNFDVESRCPYCDGVLSPDEQSRLKHDACGHELDRDALRGRVRFPGLEEAERRVKYLYETLRRVQRYLATNEAREGDGLQAVFSKAEAPFVPWSDFEKAMDEDFSTPAALAAFVELLKVANLMVDAKEKEMIGRKLKPADRARLLTEWQGHVSDIGRILGLGLREPEVVLEEQRSRRLSLLGIDRAEVESLLEARKTARAQKDFAAADAARDELTRLGIVVRDLADGVEWSVG